MRLLILSDIHSNYTALQAVMEDAGSWDEAICSGDIVGYGPDPNECIRVVHDDGFRCVMGNHDHETITGDTSLYNATPERAFTFNPHAARAIEINRSLLTPESRTCLERLPLSLSLEMEGARVMVYHGSPRDPLREYVYPLEAQHRAGEYLEATGADLLILGHTHIPYIIDAGELILLNPGSVGQPRDGDPRASYIAIDLEAMEVEHHRVEYDIGQVASRMRSMGFPGWLSDRLYHGR